ncbi:MAG TPA: immunity 17 family protein [Burkholderiales bacterium]
MSSRTVIIFAFLAGIFVLVAVVSDWNWFFEHPKAKFLVDAFGRKGARVFYGVLGCALLILGLYCGQF